MKSKNILYHLIMAGVLLLTMMCSIVTAYGAENIPDLNQKGSVSIVLQDKKNQKGISDGELTLYQVADIQNDDGGMYYRYTNGFEDCGIELVNLEDSSLAGKLEKKISASARSTTKTTDAKGNVLYADLTPGLYLIVQTKAAAGYEPISSFLVSLPLKQGDTWIYDVNASPKTEGAVANKTTGTPEKTETAVSGTKLPQTGQLNWPILVLAVAGIGFCVYGWNENKKKIF